MVKSVGYLFVLYSQHESKSLIQRGLFEQTYRFYWWTRLRKNFSYRVIKHVGYELIEVPKLSVQERTEFILDKLANDIS